MAKIPEQLYEILDKRVNDALISLGREPNVREYNLEEAINSTLLENQINIGAIFSEDDLEYLQEHCLNEYYLFFAIACLFKFLDAEDERSKEISLQQAIESDQEFICCQQKIRTILSQAKFTIFDVIEIIGKGYILIDIEKPTLYTNPLFYGDKVELEFDSFELTNNKGRWLDLSSIICSN